MPLGMCEWMLDSVPYLGHDSNNNPVYSHICPECEKKQAQNRAGPPAVQIVVGDLLDQDVDVIVNPWNHNLFPWWLLLPQGVSGAIKRRGGTTPFKELRRFGWIPLGGAVLTSAGDLPFQGIIHVAGINLLWRASERSIRDSVKNAMHLAQASGFTSIAFPLIGTGSGGFPLEQAESIMLEEFSRIDAAIAVTLVEYAAK